MKLRTDFASFLIFTESEPSGKASSRTSSEGPKREHSKEQKQRRRNIDKEVEFATSICYVHNVKKVWFKHCIYLNARTFTSPVLHNFICMVFLQRMLYLEILILFSILHSHFQWISTHYHRYFKTIVQCTVVYLL